MNNQTFSQMDLIEQINRLYAGINMSDIDNEFRLKLTLGGNKTSFWTEPTPSTAIHHVDSCWHDPDPLVVMTLVSVCYIFIFIAGVLGNVITCIVISRNKSMHTATNYYLFNLAISDLILLLSGKSIAKLFTFIFIIFPYL